MSGSPKYSRVSYSAQRQAAQQREREARERRRRERAEERRRQAQAAERRQRAATTAGQLAAVHSDLEHARRGVQFAPAFGSEINALSARLDSAQALYEQEHFPQSEAMLTSLATQLARASAEIEREAERLALRLAALEAITAGLRRRGYTVGEPLAEPDGTVAIRAGLPDAAGIDLAMVPAEQGDELVLQRHDARTPQAAAAACPSLVALHAALESELRPDGIELGELQWSHDDPDEQRRAVRPARAER